MPALCQSLPGDSKSWRTSEMRSLGHNQSARSHPVFTFRSEVAVLAESLRGAAKGRREPPPLWERFLFMTCFTGKDRVDHLPEHYFPCGFAWCLPIRLPSLLAGVKVTFVFPPVVKLTWSKSDKYQHQIGSKGIPTLFPPEHSGTRMTPGEDYAKSRSKQRRLRDICSLQCSAETGAQPCEGTPT